MMRKHSSTLGANRSQSGRQAVIKRFPSRIISPRAFATACAFTICLAFTLTGCTPAALDDFKETKTYAALSSGDYDYSDYAGVFSEVPAPYHELHEPYLIIKAESGDNSGEFSYLAATEGALADDFQTVIVVVEYLVDMSGYTIVSNGVNTGANVSGKRYASRLFYYDVASAKFVDYGFLDSARKLAKTYSGTSAPSERVETGEVVEAVEERLRNNFPADSVAAGHPDAPDAPDAAVVKLQDDRPNHAFVNGFVYWLDGSELYRMRLHGDSSTEAIATASSGIRRFFAADGWLFYDCDEGIYKVKDSGGAQSQLIEFESIDNELLVRDGKWIYYYGASAETASGTRTLKIIKRISLDGSENVQITRSSAIFGGIVNGRLYFYEYGDEKKEAPFIFSAEQMDELPVNTSNSAGLTAADAQEAQETFLSAGTPRGNWLYHVNIADDVSIWRSYVDLDGKILYQSRVTTYGADPYYIDSYTTSANFLYFLVRRNDNPANVSTLGSNNSENGAAYTIFRANLQGRAPQELITFYGRHGSGREALTAASDEWVCTGGSPSLLISADGKTIRELI